MKRRSNTIRSPIRRQRAEKYLLITLLSFAASVSITRFFLYLTGYPQIGRGELHIAHVLWGGLLLFIATLLPLILANRWAFTITAFLSGTGVGLFIDEVGKFITRSNDYFYPWAAPIIYVFFLITVLIYTRVRRPYREDLRADLYYTLDDLQEVLDHDLSEKERSDIIAHLERVKGSSTSTDLFQMADYIENFITSQALVVVPDEENWWIRLQNWAEAFDRKWMSQMRYRALLAGSLAALAIWALVYPFTILTAVFQTNAFQPILMDILTDRAIRTQTGATWYSAMLLLEILTGLMLLGAAVLFAMGRDRKAFPLGYFGLLFSLTLVNVLVFYFDQFSTILNSSVQFFVLLVTLRYRTRFFHPFVKAKA